jgi:hypothetical protein
MPFDATIGPALRRGDLNEIRVAAAAPAADVLAAVCARLRASGLDPRRARWIGPVGRRFDLSPAGYAPRTPREATWAIERALAAGEAVVAWLPSNPAGQSHGAERRDCSDRLLRRLRTLARTHGATTVLLRGVH